MLESLFLAHAANESMRARQAEISAAGASSSAAEARRATRSMERDLEKVLMITEALWEILKFQHGYTDDHLLEMIERIDQRDGRRDGKVSKKPMPDCRSCGRTLIRNQTTCLYCGTEAEIEPFDR